MEPCGSARISKQVINLRSSQEADGAKDEGTDPLRMLSRVRDRERRPPAPTQYRIPTVNGQVDAEAFEVCDECRCVVFTERSYWCGGSAATLVEESDGPVARVEVPRLASVAARARTAVEVEGVEARGGAVLLVVEGVAGANVEAAGGAGVGGRVEAAWAGRRGGGGGGGPVRAGAPRSPPGDGPRPAAPRGAPGPSTGMNDVVMLKSGRWLPWFIRERRRLCSPSASFPLRQALSPRR